MRITECAAAFPTIRPSRGLWLGLWLSALSLLLALTPAAMAQFAPGKPKIPGFPAPAPTASADAPDSVLEVVAVPSAERVAPGGDLPIALQLKFAPGWHMWPQKGAALEGMNAFNGAIPTVLSIANGADGKPADIAGVDLNLEFAQWPKLHAVEMNLGDGPMEYAVHEGSFSVFVPLSIRADAKPGPVEIPFQIRFQACDDERCEPPASIEAVVRFTIEPGASAGAPDAAFASFDPAVYGKIRSGDKPSELLEFNLFTLKFSIDPNGAGFLLLLLIAAAGGLLLNFTPCVLPVIPLKIIGLSQAAQGSRAKCFSLGFVMSLGVIAFWMALGVLMATVQGFTSANQLFQEPLFTIGVGIVIGVMAIGMAGFFSMRLPDWIYMIEAKHDSYLGSFGFGVMTAVLSTPCTAPLMGTAVAWATTQSPTTILIVFGAVGTGMALPYLVLSAFPKLVEKMPRTGPASDLIKQVMGLLLLAAAAYFIGAGTAGLLVTPPEPPSHLYWWLVAALGASAGGWLLWRTFAITKKAGNRVIFGGIGAFILAVSVLIGLSQTAKGPIDWTYYTPERLAAAQKDGKVVVIDFTAEWCANCKTLEALVLNQPGVSKELNADDVAAIKVDLTGNNEAGNALLKASNRVTIPLLLVYGRDGSVVLNASDYTPGQVIDAINAARAKEPARGE
ncbi:MAG: protein-disulfide reductase DsbD family protein [bacterium]|jgi:thiol:disulfide interchange protein